MGNRACHQPSSHASFCKAPLPSLLAAHGGRGTQHIPLGATRPPPQPSVSCCEVRIRSDPTSGVSSMWGQWSACALTAVPSGTSVFILLLSKVRQRFLQSFCFQARCLCQESKTPPQAGSMPGYRGLSHQPFQRRQQPCRGPACVLGSLSDKVPVLTQSLRKPVGTVTRP